MTHIKTYLETFCIYSIRYVKTGHLHKIKWEKSEGMLSMQGPSPGLLKKNLILTRKNNPREYHTSNA